MRQRSGDENTRCTSDLDAPRSETRGLKMAKLLNILVSAAVESLDQHVNRRQRQLVRQSHESPWRRGVYAKPKLYCCYRGTILVGADGYCGSVVCLFGASAPDTHLYPLHVSSLLLRLYLQEVSYRQSSETEENISNRISAS